MSEKYKVFSSKEINAILKSNGYICTRINKHNIYKNTEWGKSNGKRNNKERN